MKLKTVTFLFFLSFFLHRAFAQDVDAIMHGDILAASGGISFQQIAYSGNRLQASRKPYSYMLQGNVNLKILGFIDAPFTFLYSNLGNKYTQPTFNQTSLHPSYKWIKLHLGTIASSWSPYTLNGHVFRGAAVDLQPGKMSYSCAAGQFLRRVHPEGVIDNSAALPQYNRNGWGAKLEYNSAGKIKCGTSIFAAADDIQSLPVNRYTGLRPKENVSSSIQLQWSPFKKLQLSMDGGRSWLQENKTQAGFFKHVSTANIAVYNAFKVNATWSVASGNMSLNYERIDPGYQTLGAYYFNNNLENITMGMSLRLAKNKVNVQGNIGKQRDNLDKKRLSTMNRTVGSLNLNYAPGKRCQMSASFSNFVSHTNMRSFEELNFTTQPYPLWDTLNFRQISSNASGNISYQLSPSQKWHQVISVAGFMQQGRESGGGTNTNATRILNSSLRYGLQHKASGFSLSASANVNQNTLSSSRLWQLSPGLNVGMALLKKKLKMTHSWVMGKGAQQMGNYYNYRFTAGGTLGGVHNLQCSFQRLSRSGPQSFFENVFSLTYSVNTTFFDTKGKQ